MLSLFGKNLPRFYVGEQRYDAEIRELRERARACVVDLLSGALDRLTFFGGDCAAILGEAHETTKARRKGVGAELRAALAEAR